MACSEGETRSGKLLIRRDGSDAGSRPIEPCTNFWSSPDLYVQGGPSNTQAKEGVAHTIKVRVKNIASTAVEDVNVEAWVCDYTAGPLPTGQLSPPGRVTGFRGGPLDPGASAVISCSPLWTPTSAQVDTNDGHLCLAANTWAELPQFDGNELSAGGTLKMCCDSHHAQANFSLVAAEVDEEAEIGMRLTAPEEAQVMRMILDITPVTGKVGFTLGERCLLRSHEKFGKQKISISRRKPKRFFFEGEGIDPATEAELEVDSKTGTWVKFHVGVQHNSGSLQLFNITTRDPGTGDLIGGARLMVLAL